MIILLFYHLKYDLTYVDRFFKFSNKGNVKLVKELEWIIELLVYFDKPSAILSRLYFIML